MLERSFLPFPRDSPFPFPARPGLPVPTRHPCYSSAFLSSPLGRSNHRCFPKMVTSSLIVSSSEGELGTYVEKHVVVWTLCKVDRRLADFRLFMAAYIQEPRLLNRNKTGTPTTAP